MSILVWGLIRDTIESKEYDRKRISVFLATYSKKGPPEGTEPDSKEYIRQLSWTAAIG